MTNKQKKIKEAIDAYANDDCLYPTKNCKLCKNEFCISGKDAYKCLMKCLGELGVVIKGDYKIKYSTAIPAGTDLVAVEPLIKEAK